MLTKDWPSGRNEKEEGWAPGFASCILVLGRESRFRFRACQPED